MALKLHCIGISSEEHVQSRRFGTNSPHCGNFVWSPADLGKVGIWPCVWWLQQGLRSGPCLPSTAADLLSHLVWVITETLKFSFFICQWEVNLVQDWYCDLACGCCDMLQALMHLKILWWKHVNTVKSMFIVMPQAKLTKHKRTVYRRQLFFKERNVFILPLKLKRKHVPSGRNPVG